MDILKTEKVCFDIHNIRLCNDISITVKKGAFTGIIGPNGSGKSTFLKQVYGVLKPTSGVIFLHGEDISGLTNRKRAENMGVLAQENFTEFPFNVEEVTAMGRSMYHTLFQGENDTDRAIVSAVLKQVNMEDKRKQYYATLSGGEKQRVLLARALAQETKLLIMDEPTNHLDIGHQFQIMEFLKTLDMTILSAIHDLNLAARFCDYLILLHQGTVLAQGTPKEVLTEKILRDVFHIRAEMRERDGRIAIDFISSVHTTDKKHTAHDARTDYTVRADHTAHKEQTNRMDHTTRTEHTVEEQSGCS